MRHPQTLMDHFDSVSAGENVTYVLSPQRKLMHMNEAWATFARQNGGESILDTWTTGSDVLAACGPWLRAFYAEGYARACANATPWIHEYECSSPDLYRGFRMIAYPYGDWLLVTHSLVLERAHDREVHKAAAEYIDDGLVVMCSHCRRTRSRTNDDRWDWVPSFVAKSPTPVSHRLCGTCFDYYYDAIL